MCGKKELPFFVYLWLLNENMIWFCVCTVVKKVGKLVAFAFRFLEVRAFCTVISLLKPFPVNLYLKNSCEGNGIASVEPVAFPFFCEKERLEVVAFAFQFLESRAFCSDISLPKPFSVLSFIWKLPDGLELHRFDPLRFLFFLEKRMVGISCLRIPVSWKLHFSALLSRCWNPFPVNLLSEKLLWGIRICFGLTRPIFFFG